VALRETLGTEGFPAAQELVDITMPLVSDKLAKEFPTLVAGLVPPIPVPELAGVQILGLDAAWDREAGYVSLFVDLVLDPPLPGAGERDDRFGSAIAAGDFDGDGVEDLAIGIPGEGDAIAELGSVQILYGTRKRLTSRENWRFSEADPGLHGGADSYIMNRFGAALACGDFDADGFDDLAIGVPGASIDGHRGAGRVQLLRGGPGGLVTVGNRSIDQRGDAVPGAPEAGDSFGAALAVGDFDGNGVDDLAIGVPDEDLEDLQNAGAIYIAYGSPGGFDAMPISTLNPQSEGIPDEARPSEQFGHSLAAADFDADGRDDLAVGVPGNQATSSVASRAGMVMVVYGSVAPLGTPGAARPAQSWYDDSPAFLDLFGFALAAGDFDADSHADLAIGVPGNGEAGAVRVVMGSASGLTGTQRFSLNGNSFPAELGSVAGDLFGAALAAADFDGDGLADLAISATRKTYVEIPDDALPRIQRDAGAVYLAKGRQAGAVHLAAFEERSFFGQWTGGIPDEPQGSETIRVRGEEITVRPGEHFGEVLAHGDLNGDGRSDLVVGVPGENARSNPAAGAVTVGYSNGSATGPLGSWQFWSQDR
jgi:hypothetical protein